MGMSTRGAGKGSVGASGDLAPLAHLSLVLIGLGEVIYRGRRMSGKEALRRCGLKPLELEAGEGIALVNGTQVMTAVGGLATYDALQLSKVADVAAAMSLEVLMGSRTEFNQRIHRLRPHPGRRRLQTTWRDHPKQRDHQFSQGLFTHSGCVHASLLAPGARGNQGRPLLHEKGD